MVLKYFLKITYGIGENGGNAVFLFLLLSILATGENGLLTEYMVLMTELDKEARKKVRTDVDGQLGSKDRDTRYIITGELRDNSSMIGVAVEQVPHTQVDNQSSEIETDYVFQYTITFFNLGWSGADERNVGTLLQTVLFMRWILNNT